MDSGVVVILEEKKPLLLAQESFESITDYHRYLLLNPNGCPQKKDLASEALYNESKENPLLFSRDNSPKPKKIKMLGKPEKQDKKIETLGNDLKKMSISSSNSLSDEKEKITIPEGNYSAFPRSKSRSNSGGYSLKLPLKFSTNKVVALPTIDEDIPLLQENNFTKQVSGVKLKSM